MIPCGCGMRTAPSPCGLLGGFVCWRCSGQQGHVWRVSPWSHPLMWCHTLPCGVPQVPAVWQRGSVEFSWLWRLMEISDEFLPALYFPHTFHNFCTFRENVSPAQTWLPFWTLNIEIRSISHEPPRWRWVWIAGSCISLFPLSSPYSHYKLIKSCHRQRSIKGCKCCGCFLKCLIQSMMSFECIS